MVVRGARNLEICNLEKVDSSVNFYYNLQETLASFKVTIFHYNHNLIEVIRLQLLNLVATGFLELLHGPPLNTCTVQLVFSYFTVLRIKLHSYLQVLF